MLWIFWESLGSHSTLSSTNDLARAWLRELESKNCDPSTNDSRVPKVHFMESLISFFDSIPVNVPREVMMPSFLIRP